MVIKNLIIVFVFLVVSSSFAQDDFKWDWEGGGGKADEGGQKAAPASSLNNSATRQPNNLQPKAVVEDLPELEADGEKVDWDWDAGAGEKLKVESGKLKAEKKGEVRTEVSKEPTLNNSATRQPNNLQPSAVVDDTAFKGLLKENVKLRNDIDQMQLNNTVRLKENERLVRQVSELEKNIKKLGELTRKFDEEKKASDNDADKVVNLELKLTEVESEKIKMEQELDRAKVELLALEKKMRETPVVKVPKNVSPQPGSDLYKRVQAENALLRVKMVAVEQDRINAVKDREAALAKEAKIDKVIEESKQRRDQLERELDSAREKRKQQEKMIGKLMDQIPDLEKKVVKLSEKVEKSEEAIMIKDRNIYVYRNELEKRDDRLKKAEKMASLLEKSRAEVQAVGNSEKRDMHYNMAVVYSKEGRIQDAEREYLKALRLDPNDADVHYNLGVLYDDELDNNRRAAMHYRKYINLKPFAKDLDEVRVWLMECEME